MADAARHSGRGASTARVPKRLRSSDDETDADIDAFYSVAESFPFAPSLFEEDMAIVSFTKFVGQLDKHFNSEYVAARFNSAHFITGLNVLLERAARVNWHTPKSELDFLAAPFLSFRSWLDIPFGPAMGNVRTVYDDAVNRLCVLHASAVLCLYTRECDTRTIGQIYDDEHMVCLLEEKCGEVGITREAYAKWLLNGALMQSTQRKCFRNYASRGQTIQVGESLRIDLAHVRRHEGSVEDGVHPTDSDTIPDSASYDAQLVAHARTLPFRATAQQTCDFLRVFHDWWMNYDGNEEDDDCEPPYASLVVGMLYFIRAMALHGERAVHDDWAGLLNILYREITDLSVENEKNRLALAPYWIVWMRRARRSAPGAVFRVCERFWENEGGILGTLRGGVPFNPGLRDLARAIYDEHTHVLPNYARVVFMLGRAWSPQSISDDEDALDVGLVISHLHALTVAAAQRRDFFVRRVMAAHWAREARPGDAATQRRFNALVRDAGRGGRRV